MSKFRQFFSAVLLALGLISPIHAWDMEPTGFTFIYPEDENLKWEDGVVNAYATAVLELWGNRRVILPRNIMSEKLASGILKYGEKIHFIQEEGEIVKLIFLNENVAGEKEKNPWMGVLVAVWIVLVVFSIWRRFYLKAIT